MQILKLDIFTGDIAANTFANCPIWRFAGQLVQFCFINIGMFGKQLVKLLAIDGHAGILDSDAVFL